MERIFGKSVNSRTLRCDTLRKCSSARCGHSHLHCACAGHSIGWWRVPGSAAVLDFAVAVQQRINSCWDAEESPPARQPWSYIEALLSDQQAMPDAQRLLLLQLILASPPARQVTPCVGSGDWVSCIIQQAQRNIVGISRGEGN